MERRWRPNTFLAAVACFQIFGEKPNLGPLETLSSVRGVQGAPIPAGIEAAVHGYRQQGFYVMGWHRARVGDNYFVDLYHADPASLKSDRDDVRAAAAAGLGFNVRVLIRVP